MPSSRFGGKDDERVLETVPLGTETYLPGLAHYPLMSESDLSGLLRVALSTDDGVARLAEGVAGFRHSQLAEYVARNGSDIGADEAGLVGIITDSAKLEGFLQYSTGEIAIDAAEDKAQRAAGFSSMVSTVTGLLPVPGADRVGEAFGELGKNVWQYAWREAETLPTDQISDAYSANVDAVIDTQDARASAGADRFVYSTYQALVQAGLTEVSPEVATAWRAMGVTSALPALDEFPDDHFAAGIAGAAVTNLSVGLNEEYLRGVYKDQFHRFFE